MRCSVVLLASVVALAAWAPPEAPAQARRGWVRYEQLCQSCHGAQGDGRGPAAPYLWPAPRALTRGALRWRSTISGQPATADDVAATIRHGAPGTSMPGFGDVLDDAAIGELVEVVRSFAPQAIADGAPRVTLGPPPPPDPARGAALWRVKGCMGCHGERGDGEGSALRPPPYDLTAGLHRPRAPGEAAARQAAAQSIATGLSGAAMPSYVNALTSTELWALADHVVSLAARPRPAVRRPDTSARARRQLAARAIAPGAIAADRAAPIAPGTWPGEGEPAAAALFGAPIAPQGDPPAALAPAQASLSARQCARCHPAQARDWESSLHAGAASPGLLAQTEYGMPARQRAGCLRCHAPLAEQASEPRLLAEGVSCAGCHVRGWVRHGPPRTSPSLLALPSYPLVTDGVYERADFCLPCHQLTPRDAVDGRPLLDTYREWLLGPYQRRGVQCQHCHLANREHRVRGIHDPRTLREGIELTASARRRAGEITVEVSLRNIGAGHFLPTTPTPAIWISVALVDARGQPIPGAAERHRIGRDIWFDGDWHERADTRIPPGEAAHLARAWAGGRTADATAARVTVEVHPDAYYEGFYAAELATARVPAQRALYQAALDRARAARYLAEQRDVPIAR